MRAWIKRADPALLALCVAAVVALIFVLWRNAGLIRESILDSYEEINLTLFPSGQRAYAYGDRHFNASYPTDYDIPLAQSFFYKAANLDPALPYVWEELARISFLQGDFPKALAQINMQIGLEGSSTPNAYYIRGLIEGFAGDYPDSERDYRQYLQFDPIDWAAVNDYSWVLLKDNKPAQADAAIEKVLKYFPNNPWLYNSDAIALSEMREMTLAKQRVAVAAQAVQTMTPAQWALAYPGNDPGIASEGLDAFKAAVLENIHTIDAGNVGHAIQ